MKRALVISTALASALALLPALAKGPALLQGSVAQQNVEQLTTEISWYNSLYQAESEAQRTGKMIFWVHMLGDMKGAT